MNYTIDDLKEGRILVFEDNKYGRYGIITKDYPNEISNDDTLACVYNGGYWDRLKNIINYSNFTLYEAEQPLWSFIGLIKHKYMNKEDFKEICRLYNMKPVHKSVNFIDAITSRNKIKCLHDLFETNYMDIDDLLVLMGTQLTASEIEIVVRRGKWYIKEDKNE